MINQQYSGSKGVYTTSHLLGKGGEGEVYELADHPDQVLKIYSEPLSQSKAGKLQLMVNRFSEQMQAYAAWPTRPGARPERKALRVCDEEARQVYASAYVVQPDGSQEDLPRQRL